MAVPVEDAFAHGEGTVEERDEPHAALQEAAGEQAVAAEAGHERIGVVEAVEGTRGRAFARQVADFGGALLHAAGQLVGGDPGGELGVAGMSFQVFVVEQAEEVAGGPVVAGRDLSAAARGG